MKLDTAGLSKNFSMPVAVCGILDIPEEYNLSDTKLAVSIEGKLTNDGSYYLLDSVLRAEIPLCCDKCLVLVNIPIEAKMLEKFSNMGYVSKDEDVWDFTGSLINLEPAAMSCLLLNIPLKTLCGIACKGLCHVCGNDLNVKECNCDSLNIDPRMEGVLSFFQDKEV